MIVYITSDDWTDDNVRHNIMLVDFLGFLHFFAKLYNITKTHFVRVNFK